MEASEAPEKMDTMLYWQHRAYKPIPSQPRFHQIRTKCGHIDGSELSQQNITQLIIRGILDTNSGGGDRYPIAEPITRIEIFGNWHDSGCQEPFRDRGMILFNSSDRPFLHLVDAIVGYGGSGPDLTKAVLVELGIQDRIFNEIHRQYRGVLATNRHYYIVIQSTPDLLGFPEWHWASVDKAKSPYA